MSFLLKIASLWLPDFIMKKELDKIALSTINGLDKLLEEYAPSKVGEIPDEKLEGSLEERRASMAMAHNKRVKALISAIGHEKTIKIGREAMFRVGCNLGCEARQRLKVGNDLGDLELAAKILYRILGIKFKIKNMVMVVNTCSLSKYYSPEACMVLSAADEGVVHGLNKNLDMQFKHRITIGSLECIACIYRVKR
ncbi:MAG: hypothetical protein QFX38_01015 [Methanothermobacter sp.]|nr:hypothetical protein [Methanothermobacter sp.]